MSNTPTPTPRTDKSRRYAFQFTPREGVVSAEYASQLERELTAANEKIAELKRKFSDACSQIDVLDRETDNKMHHMGRQIAKKDARIAELQVFRKSIQYWIEGQTSGEGELKTEGNEIDLMDDLARSQNARIAELTKACGILSKENMQMRGQLAEARKDSQEKAAIILMLESAPVLVRCLDCLQFQQQNNSEATGSECGGCIAKERDQWKHTAEELKERLDEVRKDGEILDWLQSQLDNGTETIGHAPYKSQTESYGWEGWSTETPYFIGEIDKTFGATLRAALAARKEQAGE